MIDHNARLSTPLGSRNDGLSDIRVRAFTIRIHRGGGVAISRTVGHFIVGIRGHGTRRRADGGIATARTRAEDRTINVVTADPLSRAGIPRQFHRVYRHWHARACQSSHRRRV